MKIHGFKFLTSYAKYYLKKGYDKLKVYNVNSTPII